jgi:ABC-type multidrug transport system permease subunit
LRNAISLTVSRMRLMMRNRAFLFFSLIMPMVFLFLFLGVFGRGNPFVLPAMLAQVIALTVMGNYWGLSVQLVMFREQGILRRFRLAPIGASELLISSVIANYALTLPTILLEFILARFVFHVTEFGSLGTTFLIVTIGTISFASMGLIIASVTNTMQETQVINQLIWFAFLFLSGATFPLFLLGRVVVAVAYYLPATYLVSGLQRSLLNSATPGDLIPAFLSLGGTAIIAFVLSAKLFRWDPEDKVTRRAKIWALATIVPFLALGTWEMYHADLRNQSQQFFQLLEQQRQQAPRAPQIQQIPPSPRQ